MTYKKLFDPPELVKAYCKASASTPPHDAKALNARITALGALMDGRRDQIDSYYTDASAQAEPAIGNNIKLKV